MLLNRNNRVLAFIISAVVPVLVLVFILSARFFTVESAEVDIYAVPSITDHYKKRDQNATITLVNYFSFDCDHCRESYRMEDDLLQKYKDHNPVAIIYRHNPLPSQPLSYEKALLSECVFKQTDDATLFAFIQDVYSSYSATAKDNEWMRSIAYQHVSSKREFDYCVSDPAMKSMLEKQKNENIVSSITYTPTVLIFKDGVFVKKYDAIGEVFATRILEYYLTRK